GAGGAPAAHRRRRGRARPRGGPRAPPPHAARPHPRAPRRAARGHPGQRGPGHAGAPQSGRAAPALRCARDALDPARSHRLRARPAGRVTPLVRLYRSGRIGATALAVWLLYEGPAALRRRTGPPPPAEAARRRDERAARLLLRTAL